MSTIPRFFIPPEKIIGGEFILEDGQDIKKIRKVLRLESGDKIELNNNQGNLFLAQIEKLQKEAVSGIIIEEIELKEVGHNKPYLILAQALPKGGKMDDIIRMNTEVGVDEFIPFESEFSVVKVKDLRDKKLGKKLIRWSKIAQEAARQSERLQIPKINPPVSFESVMGMDADIKILLHSRDQEGSIDIKEVKTKLTKESVKDTKILILIGPEGGFSQKEIELTKGKGFKIVHLDLPILRTETAGVVVSGILLS